MKTMTCLLLLLALASGPAAAQDAEPTPLEENITISEGWNFSLRPYFYLSGLSGSITVNQVTVPVNSSFSTLLENVKFGGFISLTAEKGRWGVNADFQYINLYGESSGPTETSLDLRNVIGELDLIFRPEMAPTLRFLVGLRAYTVSQNILVVGRPLPEAKVTVYDPVIGAYGIWALHRKWDFELKGDVGGFGISSEATYQMMGGFRYGLGENTSIPFGYRILGYQIKKGDVRMNTRMMGMYIGFDFRF
jgi:opacity protein-like surface antigen